MSRDRFRSLSEYDDTLGGLLPSIGAQIVPGMDGRGAVLPETEDWQAFGDAPAAVELDESQDREREEAAQRRALRSLQRTEAANTPMFDEEGSPMIAPARGLGRQIGIRPRSQIVLEEIASSPGFAAAMGMGDVLIAPRALVGAATEATGGDYVAAQDEIQRSMEANPYAAATGALTGMAPLMMAGPLLGEQAVATGVGRGAIPLSAVPNSALQRAAAAGAEGLLWGGAHELAGGRPTGAEMALSGATGAAGSLAGDALGTAWQWGRGRINDLERNALRLRTRASGGRTTPVQRGLNALEGGIEGVGQDLVDTGISPRYGVHSVDEARVRAERVRDRAGRNIGHVFDLMEEADAAAAARFADEMAPVQARDAERARMRSAIEADDPTILTDVVAGDGSEPNFNRNRRLEDPLILDQARRSREAMAENARRYMNLDEAERARLADLQRQRVEAQRAVSASAPTRQASASTIDDLRARMRDLDRQVNEAYARGDDALAESLDDQMSAVRRQIAEAQQGPRLTGGRPRRRPANQSADPAADLARVNDEIRGLQQARGRRGGPGGADAFPMTPERLEAVRRGDITEAIGEEGWAFRVTDDGEVLPPESDRGLWGRARNPLPGETFDPLLPPEQIVGRAPPDERTFRLIDELLPAIEPPRPAGAVDLSPVVTGLDDAAAIYRTLPSGAGPRAAVEDLARNYRDTGGRMPYGRPGRNGLPGTGAQGELRLLDDEINWQPGSNPLNRRIGAPQADLRATRARLRNEMDAAVSRVDPELGARTPRDRREYQLGSVISGLGEDDALREAANRQISLTDYISPREGAGWPERIATILANRLFRGREASLIATGAEQLSDALQRTPNLRPYTSAVGSRAGRVAPGMTDAPDRPEPGQPRPFQGAEIDTMLQGSPRIDVAEPEQGAPPDNAAEVQDLTDEELDELLRQELSP